MISHFLNLEWKQYFRAANWQKSIFLNILLVLFALYFILSFLAIGVGGYWILKEMFPDKDPLVVVNAFLLYAFVADLIFRYLMQKLPVMNIKPMLTLPISKSKIVHYILLKSSFSFFNLMSLFFYIPFSVVLIMQGYDLWGVLGWLLTMMCGIQSVNFINFLVNKDTRVFIGLVTLLCCGFLINYFNWFNLAAFVGKGFDFLYQNPIVVLAAVLLVFLLYRENYNRLRNEVYLDALISEKTKEVNAADLSFTDKLGDLAPFIKNDLRLMWRNKRTKSGVWMLLMGLLYGLFFYPNPMYKDMDFMFVLVGVFSTGTFLINFGQFIPAWDSGYYKMLMSQNFKYERYLESKYTIMSISVAALFVLGIPYVFFGWKVLFVHFAAMIYNLGVNTHVILLGGTFNRKKINLDEKAAFNFQGTGAVQWLIGLPLMLLPMGIFALLNWLISFEIATITLAVLGFIGIALHKKLMTAITKKYITNKYVMIHAFNQEN
ncbi:MAG: DUF5687 family protein [Polaribacter sp.]|jgi:hypothetical protein